MNKAFYDSLRGTLYPNGVAVLAVNTLDDIAAKASAHGCDIYQCAYMMATAFHEVGPALLPKRESLNYSVEALVANFSRERISRRDAMSLGRKPHETGTPMERQKAIANLVYGGAWGAAELGNTGPNDGWLYRGGGLPQTTGKANYGAVGLLVGVDLVSRPDLIVRADIAVTALVVCMIHGTYTGKKLADYSLPSQFRAARAIINNDVGKNGEKIAGHARAFVKALVAGDYRPGMTQAAAALVELPAVKPAEPDNNPLPSPANQNTVKTDIPATSAGTKTAVAGSVGGAILLAIYQLNDAITAKACAWFSLFCGG